MIKLLWLQASCCGGETVSLLNAEQPDLLTTFDLLGVDLVWHPSFSRTQGDAARELLNKCVNGEKNLDILVIEGAVPTGEEERPRGLGPEGPGIAWQIQQLAAVAKHVMAAGTCACFGGVMCAGSGRTPATGVQFQRQDFGGLLGSDFLSGAGLPVVNVPGCPAHPDWITGTLTELAQDSLRENDLDQYNRPRMFYSKLAHHGCPRNEYYEFKASAEKYSQQGCLFENLGCKGTQCDSDCNERLWLARTGSCTRGGFPCLSCTSPKWPEGFVPFFETEKIGDVPTTLPLDVPKAWYVGISGLAKLACPERLSVNAVSFKPVESDDGDEQEYSV
ncbi:MAG: HupU protein [Planctomycetes bacterium]|nr:HupU protein [Planctomycetota bacterium]